MVIWLDYNEIGELAKKISYQNSVMFEMVVVRKFTNTYF